MANGLVNVKGVTAEEIATVEEILDDVITLLGESNNTGGTVSAGTVMAKLNKLLTDWTTARAGKIDTINTNAAKLTDARVGYIDKLVNFGTTSDTGGTSTAGTVMAKLNKLLTDWTNARAIKLDNIGATSDTGGSASAGTIMAKLNKLLTDWTTTRASRIDTINNAIGTTGNTGGSASAGTIMAKLNAIITASSGGLKVKSVQHGYVNSTSRTYSGYRIIHINSINLEKSILITDTGGIGVQIGSRVFEAPYLSGSTTLNQAPSGDYTSGDSKMYTYPACNWSIIEFE